jgi:hypothetical protein
MVTGRTRQKILNLRHENEKNSHEDHPVRFYQYLTIRIASQALTEALRGL